MMIVRGLWRAVRVVFGMAMAGAISFVILASMGLELITQSVAPVINGGVGDVDRIDMIIKAWRVLRDAGSLAAAATLAPALFLVLIGEIARVRSMLYYVAGGGLALAGSLAIATYQVSAHVTAPSPSVWQGLATAGFAGGFVYWLIAGRTA